MSLGDEWNLNGLNESVPDVTLPNCLNYAAHRFEKVLPISEGHARQDQGQVSILTFGIPIR